MDLARALELLTELKKGDGYIAANAIVLLELYRRLPPEQCDFVSIHAVRCRLTPGHFGPHRCLTP